jgi:hypothetical protein
MSFLQHAPRFDLTDAVRFVRELYVLEATAEPLPSERDQNFLLTTTPRNTARSSTRRTPR